MKSSFFGEAFHSLWETEQKRRNAAKKKQFSSKVSRDNPGTKVTTKDLRVIDQEDEDPDEEQRPKDDADKINDPFYQNGGVLDEGVSKSDSQL